MKNKGNLRSLSCNNIGVGQSSVLTLILSTLYSRSMNRTLYWVNIRELNRELCIGLSTLYTKTPWFMLTTSSLP